MKIVFIRHTPLGAPEAASTEYYPAVLARMGYAVTVIGRGGGDRRFLEQAGVNVAEIGADEKWMTALKRKVRNLDPDIIHTFIHLGCGLYPFVLNTRPKSKFILDIRSPLLHSGLKRALVHMKNRMEIMGYDAIAAHGIESAWTVIGRRRHIHWLPPGVDLEAISPARRPQTVAQPVRLVYIGSLHKRRAIPNLVRAGLAAAAHCDLGIDIYGEGQDEGLIRNLAAKHKQGRAIKLKGHIPRQELFNRMGRYDAGLSYIPQKIYGPAPPLKTLEYLACGLPVIATDTLGNKMFVKSNSNGLLVGEDPGAFAQGIIKMATDPDLRYGMAQLARASIMEYDWCRIVSDRLVPLYQKLMSVN